jgi:hypothetical protein
MKRLMIIVAVLFAGTFLHAQEANPNAAEMTFDESVVNDKGQVVHNYGTIAQNSDGTCEFTFKNTGKEPLVLSKVRSSCGCTVPTWPRKPIMPGEEETIKVKYDTRRLGRIYKSITIYSNAKNSPVVARITGDVVKEMQMMPEKDQAEGVPSAGK